MQKHVKNSTNYYKLLIGMLLQKLKSEKNYKSIKAINLQTLLCRSLNCFNFEISWNTKPKSFYPSCFNIWGLVSESGCIAKNYIVITKYIKSLSMLLQNWLKMKKNWKKGHVKKKKKLISSSRPKRDAWSRKN